jgi:hypothetical protein
MSAEYHPVSWYVSHPGEARATLAWCHDNLGAAKQPGILGANCENALQALNTHPAQPFSHQSLSELVGAPPTSVEHWKNDPAGRKGQLAICHNIIAAHMALPAETAAACAAAAAAGG